MIGKVEVRKQLHAHNSPDLWDRGSITTVEVVVVAVLVVDDTRTLRIAVSYTHLTLPTICSV